MVLQEGMLQILAVKQCDLLGPQSHAFSVAALALWNKSPVPQPSGMWMVLTLLAFCMLLKIWLFSHAFRVRVDELYYFGGDVELYGCGCGIALVGLFPLIL